MVLKRTGLKLSRLQISFPNLRRLMYQFENGAKSAQQCMLFSGAAKYMCALYIT